MRYPKQLFCVWGNNVSLDATCELVAPRNDSDTPPLQMHEGNMSRFVFTILNHNSNPPTALKTNIPATDIPYLEHMVEAAFRKKESLKAEPVVHTEAKNSSPAYSTTIPFGKFKGTTPASVLISNPNDKTELSGTAQFMRSNASKYPANLKIAEAIEEAIKLLDSGKLSAESSSAVVVPESSMVVYKEDIHYGRAATADGYREVTGIEIVCNLRNRYPWTVKINSLEAPVNKASDGKSVPELSKARNRKNASINLSDKDWLMIMNRLRRTVEMFEEKNFNAMFTRADDIAKSNREAARTHQNQ